MSEYEKLGRWNAAQCHLKQLQFWLSVEMNKTSASGAAGLARKLAEVLGPLEEQLEREGDERRAQLRSEYQEWKNREG